MTGTADTEAYEFQQIYGLEVVVVPTHMKMVRADRQDQVYRTAKEKYQAVINDIRDCHDARPAGAGRHHLDRELGAALRACCRRRSSPHQVLNAKQHAREAEIVAQAGRPKMVTIATNMAGRGTDIVLGGNVEKQCDFVEADEKLAPEEKQTAHRDAARRMAGAARPGGEGGRPAHHRHRAPRVAAHRQPAARPLRPPGRPGQLALLHGARGPAAAHLRRRAHQPHHGDAQDARGRGDRARDGDALDRERAAQGRGAQLRHPQAAARVRRRRQRPEEDDLRAEERAARVAGRLAAHRRPARRRDRRTCSACTCPRRASRSSGTSPAWRRALKAELQLELPLRALAGEGARAAARGARSSASWRRRDEAYRAKVPGGRRGPRSTSTSAT